MLTDFVKPQNVASFNLYTLFVYYRSIDVTYTRNTRILSCDWSLLHHTVYSAYNKCIRCLGTSRSIWLHL